MGTRYRIIYSLVLGVKGLKGAILKVDDFFNS